MNALQQSRALRGKYLVILSAFLVSLLSGCATVEGVGEDVQSAGEAIEGASEDAQNYQRKAGLSCLFFYAFCSANLTRLFH